MNRAQREEMELIIRKEAADFAIASISNEVIDEINILQASLRAMDEAVKQLKITPAFLLVDGNRFIRNYTIPYHCAVKGDNTFLSIAAASILAKTHRDRLMENLSQDYPHYDWATNKGYPTPGHKKAIREHGISPYHRQSFHMNEKSIQLKINF
jgi:ribonuclease HII